jgi:DNA-binding winged helix-turn-helix (wHTH) protein
MTTNGPDSSAQLAAGRLRFDRYVLDLDRGCLLLDGREMTLRPKTFAVLRYLVENAGRLVSKDELFAAVWPNLAVTDDVLVQSIGELRRELGEDGLRLIKTIPRRGYRFESAVSSIAPDEPSVTDATPVSPASYDSAGALRPASGAHAGTWLTTARSGRGWFAALALVVFACGSGTVGRALRVEISRYPALWRAILQDCRPWRETRYRNSPLCEPERRFGA